MASSLDKYHHCRTPGCENILNHLQVEYALRKFEQTHCSTECASKDWQYQGYCCEKAEPIDCVCARSWKCPDHGVFHVGTHD